MKLIVGLGNPGPQYRWNRHNLGFLVLEALGRQEKVSWQRSSTHHGMLAKTVIGAAECSLLMPTTFMNHSGLSVKSVAGKKPVAVEDILVVCDDLSLPFGRLRLRAQGSHGGNNGLKSIINDLGSRQFFRLRLGIGAPSGDSADYVLADFTPAQKKSLPDFINLALDCVTSWVTEGATVAMNKYN